MTNKYYISYIDNTISPACESSDCFDYDGLVQMVADDKRGEIRIISVMVPDGETDRDITASVLLNLW